MVAGGETTQPVGGALSGRPLRTDQLLPLTILSEMSVHHSQLQGELGRLKGVFPGLGSYVL